MDTNLEKRINELEAELINQQAEKEAVKINEQAKVKNPEEEKELEKKTPSTAANATSLSAKLETWSSIHFAVHSAFFFILGTFMTAFNRKSRSLISRTYVCINSLYMVEWIFSTAC